MSCAPSKSITLEFYLRLPQYFFSSPLVFTTTAITDNTSPLTPTPPQTVANLEFTFGNLLDNIHRECISLNYATSLSSVVILSRNHCLYSFHSFWRRIFLSTPYGVPSVANIPSSTPKMDWVCSIALSSGFMTYKYRDSRFSRFSDLFRCYLWKWPGNTTSY